MIRKLKYLLLLAVGVSLWQGAAAQHTLGFVVGYGSSGGNFIPKQETKSIWGSYSGGLSWRYYGKQRFIGGFGIDLEFVQQGFSFAQNTSETDDKKEFIYYTRHINSIQMPIVWQPHFYLAHNHIRLYLEAAATFSYQLSSSYENALAQRSGRSDWKGKYNLKTVRDNRWGYGLAGGAGFAILIKRYELNVRARYYFGLSDVLKNSNKYGNNATDGSENPFYNTPQRSPLNNIVISIGFSYRFNKDGFSTWAPRPKKPKQPPMKLGL